MNEAFPLLVITVLLSATLVACGMGVIWYVRSTCRTFRSDIGQGARAWTGATFDSKAVTERVRRLREDYLAALMERPDDELQRAQRVIMARRKLGSRPYFRHHPEQRLEHVAEVHPH